MIPESDQSKVDAELIKKLKAEGGESPIRLLYERHVQGVYRHCRAYGIPPADAEEIVQDVFFSAFTKLSTLDHPEKFGAWLAAITRNRCFQCLRKRSRRAPLEQRLDDNLPIPDLEAREARLHEQKLLIVRDLISRVKNDGHRRAIELFYLEGLSCEEISQRQNMTVTNVTTQLARFRARVQRELIRRMLELEHE
jgi:RNA polymerase sigma-70 factor (ECF subfamily)